MPNEKTYFKGIARVLVGDPTTANGAGLTDLDEAFNVTVQLNERKSIANGPNGLPQADSVHLPGSNYRITIEHHKATDAVLAALFDSMTVSGSELLTETAWQSVTVNSMIVVPIAEYGSAASSNAVWYFPGVTQVGSPSLTYDERDGENAQNNYTSEFISLERLTDQDSTALGPRRRTGWRGTKLSGWSFPSGY